jgi:PST family polysaccharide transporter
MFEEIKSRSLKGLIWATGESIGVAMISLASFIVLARLLSPRDFGVVALAGVFVYFCNLLTGHSFTDALVQRRAIGRSHVDTAFWSTLALALMLMAGCQAGAGVAARLLGEPALAEVLPWLSLVLPLGALSSVQMALFRREMRFDAVARRTLIGRSLGAAAGIAAAAAGYGFWSLVVQQLVGQLALAVVFATAPWWPRFRFSRRRFREMWAFGAQVSASQVLSGAAEQALNLLIGTLLGATALGHFTIAWRAVQIIGSLASGAVYHVGLSAFSKLQQERQRIAEAFLKATRLSCLVGFPIAVGIALVAEPFVLTAFGEKWRASIPLLSILALTLMPGFYGMFLSPLYLAMGRAGWGLATELIYVAVGLGSVLVLAPHGLQAVVAVWVARAFVLMPMNVMLVCRLLALPLGRLAQPVGAPLAGAVAMAAGIAGLRLALPAGMAPAVELALLVPVSALIYVTAIRLLAPQLFGLALRTAGVMGVPARRHS